MADIYTNDDALKIENSYLCIMSAFQRRWLSECSKVCVCVL